MLFNPDNLMNLNRRQNIYEPILWAKFFYCPHHKAISSETQKFLLHLLKFVAEQIS